MTYASPPQFVSYAEECHVTLFPWLRALLDGLNVLRTQQTELVSTWRWLSPVFRLRTLGWVALTFLHPPPGARKAACEPLATHPTKRLGLRRTPVEAYKRHFECSGLIACAGDQVEIKRLSSPDVPRLPLSPHCTFCLVAWRLYKV